MRKLNEEEIQIAKQKKHHLRMLRMNRDKVVSNRLESLAASRKVAIPQISDDFKVNPKTGEMIKLEVSSLEKESPKEVKIAPRHVLTKKEKIKFNIIEEKKLKYIIGDKDNG